MEGPPPKVRSGISALLAFVLLFSGSFPAYAWGRKGDKLYKEGRAAEVRKEWEKALDLFEQAILDDPYHVGYQMAARRVRFQASQQHVNTGQKLRGEGKLEDALAEFQKAFAIDPSSTIADQEIKRTLQMMDREKKKGQPGSAEQRALTPTEQARREIESKIESMLPAPELRPLNSEPITLRMNNQPPKVLFETIGKLAGINVIFDTEYNVNGRFVVDLNRASLEQALDYVAVQTKSFWKPLSANTIFVTLDNVTKRRDYEDNVVKTFYISNTGSVQELQEIATAVRSVTEIRRLFVYNGQNAILIRGTADQVALAEKLLLDLDKPKSEVVIDVMVMEVSKSKSRDLAASIANGSTPGINIPVGFTPRNPVLSGNDPGTDTGTGGSGTGSGTTNTAISLARIGRVSTNDFSVTLPGAIFRALFSDREGRVLQSPQVRAVENQKASLRLGDKIPYATGSFQSGMGAVGAGISPLVSTQFNFAEVGVNLDITPKVHGSEEVSLHIELDLSTLRERIDVGGLQQPVIGQRKITHDIRMREGEVNILGGLTSMSDSRTSNGIPGVGQLPGLRRLFGSENKERIETELLIALVPHIIRSPEITPANLKGIAAGSEQVVKLRYEPRTEDKQPAKPDTPPTQTQPPANPAARPPFPVPAGPPNSGMLPIVPAGSAQIVLEQAKAPGMVMVTAQVRNTTDLFAAPMRVQFDPKVLKLVEVTRGTVLAPQGEPLNFTPILDSAAMGEARVELSRLPGSGGVVNGGPLVTFRFETVGKGTTTVSLSDLNLRDSQNQPIPAAALPATVVVD